MSEGSAGHENVSGKLLKPPEVWREGGCIVSVMPWVLAVRHLHPGTGLGLWVPAEEHKPEFLSKGFPILIFCASASVLGDGFLCQPQK